MMEKHQFVDMFSKIGADIFRCDRDTINHKLMKVVGDIENEHTKSEIDGLREALIENIQVVADRLISELVDEFKKTITLELWALAHHIKDGEPMSDGERLKYTERLQVIREMPKIGPRITR